MVSNIVIHSRDLKKIQERFKLKQRIDGQSYLACLICTAIF